MLGVFGILVQQRSRDRGDEPSYKQIGQNMNHGNQKATGTEKNIQDEKHGAKRTANRRGREKI